MRVNVLIKVVDLMIANVPKKTKSCTSSNNYSESVWSDGLRDTL